MGASLGGSKCYGPRQRRTRTAGRAAPRPAPPTPDARIHPRHRLHSGALQAAQWLGKVGSAIVSRRVVRPFGGAAAVSVHPGAVGLATLRVGRPDAHAHAPWGSQVTGWRRRPRRPRRPHSRPHHPAPAGKRDIAVPSFLFAPTFFDALPGSGTRQDCGQTQGSGGGARRGRRAGAGPQAQGRGTPRWPGPHTPNAPRSVRRARCMAGVLSGWRRA